MSKEEQEPDTNRPEAEGEEELPDLPENSDDTLNTLKVRDDQEPVIFEETGDGIFKLRNGQTPAWLKNENEFKVKDLRQRIEPWLTSLFQSEHLSLLVGSGLTQGVHRLATGELATGMKRVEFSELQDEISQAVKHSAEKSARGEANFEDDIRVANDLLRGLEILNDERAAILDSEIQTKLKTFAESILKDECRIATASNDNKRETAFNTLVSFLMSFASRSGTRDRLNIFTTNYDRLIETGAEFAGLHLIDRFIGNLTPIFRSSRMDLDMHYNPPGIRGEPRYLEGVARFTKLHGSIDWIQTENEIRRIGLPLGANSVEPYLSAPEIRDSRPNELMIYPNSAKDRETTDYPYVELFRDFAASTCRPNSTLVTYGYGFGDDHLNRVIADMLTIPSTHLVIISYNDPSNRIMNTVSKWGRRSQTSLLIGPALGELTRLSENYLPKSAIDRATFRMADILKRRFGPGENTPETPNPDDPDDEGGQRS